MTNLRRPTFSRSNFPFSFQASCSWQVTKAEDRRSGRGNSGKGSGCVVGHRQRSHGGRSSGEGTRWLVDTAAAAGHGCYSGVARIGSKLGTACRGGDQLGGGLLQASWVVARTWVAAGRRDREIWTVGHEQRTLGRGTAEQLRCQHLGSKSVGLLDLGATASGFNRASGEASGAGLGESSKVQAVGGRTAMVLRARPAGRRIDAGSPVRCSSVAGVEQRGESSVFEEEPAG